MPRIKERRIEVGLTQEQVAELLKTDVPSVSRLENFKCLPVPQDMNYLCEILECAIADIYEKEEITFKDERKVERKKVYRVSASLPVEAKERIKECLGVCGYGSVTDWIRACYRRLLAQYDFEQKRSAQTSANVRAQGGKPTTQEDYTTHKYESQGG